MKERRWTKGARRDTNIVWLNWSDFHTMLIGPQTSNSTVTRGCVRPFSQAPSGARPRDNVLPRHEHEDRYLRRSCRSSFSYMVSGPDLRAYFSRMGELAREIVRREKVSVATTTDEG